MPRPPHDPATEFDDRTLRPGTAEPLRTETDAEKHAETPSETQLATQYGEGSEPTRDPERTAATEHAHADSGTQADHEAGPTTLPTEHATNDVSTLARTPSASEPAASDSGVRSEGGSVEALSVGGKIQPGEILFGRFKVEKMLGEGGMGTVWLVRHLELNSLRALKLIVSGIAFDPDARSRFRREARVMALLTHPNAVTVHDARMATDAAFIEMEYVRGQSLNKLIKTGVAMPLDWVARMLEQLCDVLQAAHELKIVHRDLKPANMMLLEGRPVGREHLKVLDFGIAKILEADSDTSDVKTHTGAFMGSAPYSSPEQAGAGPIDGRSDLYSLGVILYEFLTGSRPFTGNITRLIYDHLYTPPPPFAAKNPNVLVPSAVEQVVRSCLAKNPDDRPQSARDLFEAFRRALPEDLPGRPPSGSFTSSMTGTEDIKTEDGNLVPYQPQSESATALAQTLGGVPRPAPTRAEKSKPERIDTLPLPRPDRGRRWIKLIGPVVGLLMLGAVVFAAFWFLPRQGGSQFPPRGYKAEASAKLVQGLPSALVRTADGTRFLLIEGGDFVMGNHGFDTKTGEQDEDQPDHPVRLSSYYIQETEVTNGELEAYFEANHVPTEERPQRWREACDRLIKEGRDPKRYPAVGVAHELAEKYARWAGGRLTTEAQWEYAARSRGKEIIYVWGKNPQPAKKNANIDSLDVIGVIPTVAVGSRPKDVTEQGILDLTGNVREWCHDLWSRYVESQAHERDPEGPTASKAQPPEYVIRGGSFATWADAGRTTRPRRADDPRGLTAQDLAEDGTARDLGFRIVVEAPKAVRP